MTFLRRASTIDMEQLRGLDAVLISHAHHDHLDLRSLERLGRSIPVVVPRGLGRLLQGRTSVIEVVEDEETAFGAVTVRATHAEHEGRRHPGRIEAAPLGFAISGSRRIYFAGDTDLFPDMDGLVPDLDLALIPIGWGPSTRRRRAPRSLGSSRGPARFSGHGLPCRFTGAPTGRCTAAPVPRFSMTPPRHSRGKQLQKPQKSRSGCCGPVSSSPLRRASCVDSLEPSKTGQASTKGRR